MSAVPCATCSKPIVGRAVVIVDDVAAIRPFTRYHHPACALPLIRPAFVDGWKGIAAALGKAERTVRLWAAREDDPLPVGALGGVVRASHAALEEWTARQATRPARPPVRARSKAA
jgi:hypothetical protein